MDTSALIALHYDRKPNNLKTLVTVYETIHANRQATPKDIIELTQLPQRTVYRAIEELRNKKLLDKDSRTELRFNMPSNITAGMLPPEQYIAVHFAAYLTKFKDNDVVPPYGKTRREILDLIREKLGLDVERSTDIVMGLQDRLAWLALYTGDLKNFANMSGNLIPPNSLNDLSL